MMTPLLDHLIKEWTEQNEAAASGRESAALLDMTPTQVFCRPDTQNLTTAILPTR